MSYTVYDGNVKGIYVVSVSITPASVPSITAPEQLFGVPGVQLNDVVLDVNTPAPTAGVTLGSKRVSAAGQVGLQFVNPTAGAVVPAPGVYKFIILRVDGVPLGIAQ